jgi:hypothetical protein
MSKLIEHLKSKSIKKGRTMTVIDCRRIATEPHKGEVMFYIFEETEAGTFRSAIKLNESVIEVMPDIESFILNDHEEQMEAALKLANKDL